MHRRAWFFLVAGLALLGVCSARNALAEILPYSITLNLVEKPTNNKNIFGTTFNSGTVTNWGSNYMKYEVKLQSTASYDFSNLYVQVFANRGNQNTNPLNSLRVALFDQDPTATFLSDADAITQTSLNQASVSPTFTEFLIGPANPGPFVGTDPFVWYLMLYAEGNVANQGYGLKIDSVLRDVEYYAPDDPDLSVQYANQAGTFLPAQTFVPVPEPAVGLTAIVGLGMAAAAARTMRRRRPRRAAAA